MQAAVFLDRDNTIIENDGDLGDPSQVRLIQGAASAIASLRGLGYRIVVVTNQGGVARGKYTEQDVDRVHQRINELVHAMSGVTIDRFYYCPFHPEATVERYKREHPWRKPQPGMLLEAARDMELDLGQSWMIGDQLRDVEAGRAAGVRTVLLHPDAVERPPLGTPDPHPMTAAEAEDLSTPHFTARNLIDAVKIVAQQRKPIAVEEARKDAERRRWTPPAAPASKPSPGPTTTEHAPPGLASPVNAAPPAAPVTPKPMAQRGPLTAPIPVGQTTPPVPAPTVRRAASPIEPPREPQPSRPVTRPAAVPPEREPSPSADHQATSAPSEPPRPIKPAGDAGPDSDMLPSTDLPAQDEAFSRPGGPPVPSAEQTLRQILQELRNQRAGGSAFSYLDTLVLVLQVLAAVCLVGALWLGRDNTQDAYFTLMRWLGSGVLIQLAAIALLLMRRRL